MAIFNDLYEPGFSRPQGLLRQYFPRGTDLSKHSARGHTRGHLRRPAITSSSGKSFDASPVTIEAPRGSIPAP